ncbi:MAG: OmpA family protein [Bacteroidales bacterium]|jgi:outer membrane protein OmpA-like peptidoglycan-associated protein|nr:OmpA family protein [Bacteroidales bacterium]
MEKLNENQTNLESKKTENSQIATQNEEQAKKDAKQAKKRKKIILWIAIVAILLIGGGGFYLYYSNNLDGFLGVGAVDDTMNVSLENVTDPATKLKMACAINATVDGGLVIEDIKSLKEAFEANKNALLSSNNNVIEIPTIGVKFAMASADLSSVELVKEYANIFLQTDKSATILIEGYACNIGDENSNMLLSENRANAVKQILVNSGISEKNIEVKWYGEAKYNELGYKTNEEHRRVNVSIKQK